MGRLTSLIGRKISHYNITAKLGEGGMGEVYRARDTRLDRQVALKVIGESSPGDEAARARLLQEAQAAAALNHPNICHIYEVGEAEGQAFIAMELVEGQPLNARIPVEGMPLEGVLRYGAQVADALAHAHERGLVHRDLKSANVVVTQEGRAKILDFGLAKRVDQTALAEATRSTKTAAEAEGISGTLPYMAPETLRGEPADARSDIWALGVVLYEMASGRLPFEGKTAYQLSSEILQAPPRALPARTPAALRAIVQRCLVKEPGERYRSASEVRAALEALQTSEVMPAAAPGSNRSLSRAWWILGIALLLTGGVVAAVKWGVSFHFGSSAPEVKSTGGPQPIVGFKPSPNAEANEYFQRAILLLLGGRLDVPRARELMGKAVELDPHFGEARAAYGFTDVLLIEVGISNDPSLLYEAEEAEKRALQDDPEAEYGRVGLAGVYLLQGRTDLVPRELGAAERTGKNSVGIKMWWLLYYKSRGDYGRAEALAREILALAPTFFPARTFLGEILREQGKLPEVVGEQEKVLDQDPTNTLALRHLARTYIDAGDLKKARATLERARPDDRQNYRLRMVWALLLAQEGNRAEARKEMDPELEKYAGVHALVNADAADFYAALGEKEKALEWLDRAVRNGDERGEWFQRDPLLASIRTAPRFKQILDSIAFRRQQRASTGPTAALSTP